MLRDRDRTRDRLRRLRPLALIALLVSATPAAAVCGNGTLDTGEACDTTAAGGDAACPRACVRPGLVAQCTCARPSTDARRYVVTAASQIRLAAGTIVGLGHLAVTQPAGMMQIGRDAS